MLPRVPWKDDCYYLQAQAYWILCQIELFQRTGRLEHRNRVERCAATICERQLADGSWDYPSPEWRGRLSTVEGLWAAIGLLRAHRLLGGDALLSGALRWHDCLTNVVGWQDVGDTLAVNYFGSHRRPRVTNVSVSALAFLAELAAAAEDQAFLAPCDRLLGFVTNAQTNSGELPYALEGSSGETARPHFQCPQYNAFQALALCRYHALTGDDRALQVARNILTFLAATQDGHTPSCGPAGTWRITTYHAAALGAAFLSPAAEHLGNGRDRATTAFRVVLDRQTDDGSIPHSSRERGLLSDRRSYPRYLAMILLFLLRAEEQLGT